MLQPRLPDKRRLLPLLLLLAVAAPACFNPPQSGVSVKALAADLVFGIPPLQEPVTPPDSNPVSGDAAPVVSVGGVPEFTEEPPAPPERCPEANPTDFPDAAPSVVERQPAAGTYEWVVAGYQDVEDIGRVGLPQFHNRLVGNVSGTPLGFQFTTLQPELAFGARELVEQTYEVRDEDGIFLTQLVRIAEDGSRRAFNPSPAMEIFPMPAEIGGAVSTTGVDPATLEAFQIEGSVARRVRPDACGEFVDAWLVESVKEFTSVLGESNTWRSNYAIATGIGGLIAFEHLESPLDDPQLVYDARIGQLTPN